jgi:putative redox protein
MIVEATHAGGLEFHVRAGDHQVILDAKAPTGKDHGPSPKEMLLAAVLGCTGMDVAGLIKKYKMEPDEFSLIGEAIARDEHPKIFPRMDVIYRLKGKDLDAAKIQQAVELSMTKYCGVSAMVAEAAPIYYTIEINGEVTGKGQARF